MRGVSRYEHLRLIHQDVRHIVLYVAQWRGPRDEQRIGVAARLRDRTGRGYRPEQVDAYFAALSRVRDTAWERAARLTVLAKEMDAEVGRLREVVARLAPQTYETLGERACRIRELGEEEAAAVRENARSAARLAVEEAEAEGGGCVRRRRRTPTSCAARPRSALGTVSSPPAPRPTRCGSPPVARSRRAGEVLAALREVRQRTEGFLADQERNTRSAGRRRSVRRWSGRPGSTRTT